MLSAFRKEKQNISLHSHIKKFQAGPDLAAKSASGKAATLIPDASHAAAMRRNRLNELAASLADVPVCIPGWGNMLFSGHGEPAEEQSRTKKKRQKGKAVEPAAAPSCGGPAAAPSGDVPAPAATKVRNLDKICLVN